MVGACVCMCACMLTSFSLSVCLYVCVKDDDGDFDDLYGNTAKRTSESTLSALNPHRIHSNNTAQPPASGRRSMDGGAYSYPVSPVSSIPSTTYSRSDAGAATTPSGPVQSTRKAQQTKTKTKQKASRHRDSANGRDNEGDAHPRGSEQKMRRRGSAELFNVDWDDDDRVKACFLCSSSFSLMKRKHHCRYCSTLPISATCVNTDNVDFCLCGCCRHCGRVMCSDCSSFRYFELTHKKHRVCSSCNSELARQNRLGGSEDDDGRLDHSVVTDDDDSDMHATPSSSSGRRRGKFRESIKKTFTPKDSKKKEERRQVDKEEKKKRSGGSTGEVAQSEEQEFDERKQPSDLFNIADDTWFTDPLEGESRSARKKGNLFAFDDQDGTFMREEKRYSLAQPRLGTAADEWQAELSRHTIAATRGGFPKTVRQDSLSIDAYENRSDDDYDPSKRTRMEMPRPEQQLAIVKVETRRQEIETLAHESDDGYHSQGRSTLKENLKDIFRIHSKKDGSRKRKKQDKRASQSEAKSNTQPPRPSEHVDSEEPSGAPARPAVYTQARPTFYDANADDLVVDDTPGYFDRTNAQDFNATVGQQRRDADYSRWASAPLPKSVEPRAISSDLESYSIIEPPISMETTATMTQEPREEKLDVAPASSPDASGSGFTGALKRFFGLSGSKSPGKHAEPLGAQSTSRAAEIDAAPSNPPEILDKQHPEMSTIDAQSSFRESNVLQKTGSFDRFSMMERSFHGSDVSQHDRTRYTTVESANPATDFQRPDPTQRRVSAFASSTSNRDVSQRNRRDTFDDLFSSPKSQTTASSDGKSLPTRAWDGVATGSSAMIPTTGVDRFDRRRENDAGYEIEQDVHRPSPERYTSDRSRTSSIGLGESHLSAEKLHHESNGTTGSAWNAVRSVPSFGVATYAVPASVSTDRFASKTSRYEEQPTSQPASSHSIMEDLNHGSSRPASSARQANSVDDFFAEFERPNEYVFDPDTGGYVSAAAPKRVQESSVRRDNFASTPNQERRAAVSYSRELQNEQYEQSERRRGDNGRKEQIDEDDALDETIVDKISSLEGELAALKQLIRKRKDHEHPASGNAQATTRPPSVNPAMRRSVDDQSSRKMSIFDNDSSEEEKVVRKKSVKKSAKKKAKRRDSFADLFEDSPGEDSSLAGGKGYESLFQTGPDTARDSSGDDEEEEKGRAKQTEKAVPTVSKAKTRRKMSYDDLEDEEEYPSLKNRSGKGSTLQRKKESSRPVASSLSESEEEKTTSSSSKTSSMRVVSKEDKPERAATPAATAAYDPIDALFDSSAERDVTNFFEFDGKKSVEAQNSLEEETGKGVGDKRAISQQDHLHREAEAPNENGLANDVDSDEEFALNLLTTKSGRSQRGSLKPSPVTTPSRIAHAIDLENSVEEKSGVDSDEEFARSLRKGRAASHAKRGSRQAEAVSTIGLFSDTLSQELNEDASQTQGNVIDSDEEFALDLKKSGRGESDSFVDAQQQPITSESSHLDAVDESEGAAAVESVSAPLSNLRITTGVFDGEETFTEAVELKMATNTEDFSAETAPSVSVANVSEPTQPSTHAATPNSPDNATTDKSATTAVRKDDVDVDQDALRLGRSVGVSTDATDQVSDDSFDFFDQSDDPYSIALGSTSLAEEESEGEGFEDDNEGGSEAFSFEVQPKKKRASQNPIPSIESGLSKKKPVGDQEESLVLGKYASGTASRQQNLSEIGGGQTEKEAAMEENDPEATADVQQPFEQQTSDSKEVDADWQQMQEEEKERRKKLQLKQRQAQRDKLLKKQGLKQANPPSSASSTGGEKKKKKKDKAKDPSESSSGSRKKSSSRKHKHKPSAAEDDLSKENIDSTPSTLTEL